MPKFNIDVEEAATIKKANGKVDKTHGLGVVLKMLRKRTGLTQVELADAASLGRTSITNIELGNQTLTPDALYAIANALGYSVHITFRKKP